MEVQTVLVQTTGTRVARDFLRAQLITEASQTTQSAMAKKTNKMDEGALSQEVRQPQSKVSSFHEVICEPGML